MKLNKELKTGVITLVAIGLLVTGVNFLKGNSFFGGDDQYFAYFPNSGNLAPATSVYVNGVSIGKVLTVKYVGGLDSLKKVEVSFTIQDKNIRISKKSDVLIGSIDPLTKGIILNLNPDDSKGYYSTNDKIQGKVDLDIISQFKSFADPVVKKFQTLMNSVDKTVSTFNKAAENNLEESINEIQTAIKKFGNVAEDVDQLVSNEKQRLSKIFSNVESITLNLKNSNDQIKSIIGNTKQLTDDLVSADFKTTINNASKTLSAFAQTLEKVNSGEGSLGKLVKDEKLYNELVETNQSVQNLTDDLKNHPERYVRISVFGGKTKGLVLNSEQEKKLVKLLDSIPN